MNKKLKKAVKICALTIAAAAALTVCLWLIQAVLSLREPDTREAFRSLIESLGFLGVIAMLLLQMLQIVVAVIPGEPIEILMGLMYGTVGGLILTLVGILLGQTVIFFAVKRFGIKFAGRFVDTKKFDKLAFLNNSAKRDSLIFILYFIPGTPKDILTYFVPFTDIPLLRFILLSALARIPSVVSSTWAGASISDGSFIKTLIIFAVTGVVGIIGIILNDIITKKYNKVTKEKE